MKVAAVIVNFNAGDHLATCVAALRTEGLDRIVVVDNGSTDGSLDELRRVDPTAAVVELGRNLGYGAAANRGVASLAEMPDAVLVCNPDTTVHPGVIKALVEALDADGALGIIGPGIENTDGTIYPSARTFPVLSDAIGHAFLGWVWPTNQWTRRYRMLDWDHATARSVDWVSGAFFLTRGETWQQLQGFDERYFMYMEDTYLCWRAHRLGWDVAYDPTGRVTHVQGVSTNRRPYRMIAAHHRSMFRFAADTTEGPARMLLPLMALGMVVRTLLAFLERAVGSRRSRIAAAIR